jgi:hypothetical protein
MPSPIARSTTVLVAAAILVLGPAGCSSKPAPRPSAPSATLPAEHGLFAKCMQDNGVPAARGLPLGPPPGVDPGVWQKALQVCSALAPGPAAH